MKYFKNAELARLYNVSEKSVRNWISAAEQGKVDLELFTDNGKTYVADSLHNEASLQNFTERAKKYRNSQALKKLQPTPEFHDLFSQEQIMQIASELEMHRELPQQFRYLGQAGVRWSSYLHKLYGGKSGNNLTNTIKLLHLDNDYILDVVDGYDHINLVDIGVGNGLAVKNLVSTLHETGKLHTYIGIDISPELLAITAHNLETWFEGQINFEGHVVDISNTVFSEIVSRRSFEKSNARTINIFTFVGGLLPNFRNMAKTLDNIRESMNPDDILLTGTKLDSPEARRFFDFNAPYEKQEGQLPAHHRVMLDHLNIEPELYEVEQLYDPETNCRYTRVKLKTAVSLLFDSADYRRTVEIEKGERIILWRAWHMTNEELIALYSRSGFKLLRSTTTADCQPNLMISGIRRG